MIFGKTSIEKEEIKQAKLRERSKWRKKFAWYPMQLNSGEWIWLEYVVIREIIYESINGRLYAPIFREYSVKKAD